MQPDQDRLREILNELHWENIAHLTGTHSNDDSHVVKAEKAIQALIAREVRLGKIEELEQVGAEGGEVPSAVYYPPEGSDPFAYIYIDKRIEQLKAELSKEQPNE